MGDPLILDKKPQYFKKSPNIFYLIRRISDYAGLAVKRQIGLFRHMTFSKGKNDAAKRNRI